MNATPKMWIRRCLANIEEFEESRELMSKAEQLKFIREQYEALAVVKKVIHGTAKLRGVDHYALPQSTDKEQQ